MQPNIAGAGATVAVAIESGLWIPAATLQFGAEDICGHTKDDNGASAFVIPSGSRGIRSEYWSDGVVEWWSDEL